MTTSRRWSNTTLLAAGTVYYACGKGCQTSKVKTSPKNRDHAHFWERFKDNYFMRPAGQLGSLDIFIKYLT